MEIVKGAAASVQVPAIPLQGMDALVYVLTALVRVLNTPVQVLTTLGQVPNPAVQGTKTISQCPFLHGIFAFEPQNGFLRFAVGSERGGRGLAGAIGVCSVVATAL